MLIITTNSQWRSIFDIVLNKMNIWKFSRIYPLKGLYSESFRMIGSWLLNIMIKSYLGDYKSIADLFYASVHEVASSMYTEEQINVWAPLPIDYENWKNRCEIKRPFICIRSNKLAGFIEIDPDGHIDCHYVHPQFIRQGVATELLQHVLDISKSLSLPKLYVEASHLIKPLYLKHGFKCISKNTVVRKGVLIDNWLLELRNC